MLRSLHLLFLVAATVSARTHYNGIFRGLTHEDLVHVEDKMQAASVPPVPPHYTIDVPIDHFNQSDARTYKNHYWVNDTFYRPGGPVFFYDGGEGTVSSAVVLVMLAEAAGPSAPMALARHYGGLAVAWEHRFYGQSLPFELNDTTGLAFAGYDAYKYLTNEQALEDACYFAQHFAHQWPSSLQYGSDLHPSSTPWVFVGGSYPGMRGAMLRERNPETWFASWASSAPVQARVDMSVYFRPIEKVMPSNCSSDMHVAVRHADRILRNGSKSQVKEVCEAMLTVGGQLDSNNNATKCDLLSSYPGSGDAGRILWDIAGVLGYALEQTPVSYQNNGFSVALQPFCNYLEQYVPSYNSSGRHNLAAILNNPRNATATSKGIAATYNSSVALDALLSATWAKKQDDSGKGYRFAMGDAMSWTWQFCSQFGFFQDTNQTDPLNLISRFNNLTSFEYAECRSVFPYAPERPDIEVINGRYRGWQMKPSNVMFSNGEVDPWRTLGVQSDYSINPYAFVRNSTKTVPRCNTPPPGNDVFGQVYPGQVHCQDLIKATYRNRTGVAPFDLAFDLFTEALDSWLPCFEADRGYGQQPLIVQ